MIVKKTQIMPVWSLKNRALKVRDEDFEECELVKLKVVYLANG